MARMIAEVGGTRRPAEEEAAEPPIVVTHVVQRGRNVVGHRPAYGIDVDTIVAANESPTSTVSESGESCDVDGAGCAAHRAAWRKLVGHFPGL